MTTSLENKHFRNFDHFTIVPPCQFKDAMLAKSAKTGLQRTPLNKDSLLFAQAVVMENRNCGNLTLLFHT